MIFHKRKGMHLVKDIVVLSSSLFIFNFFGLPFQTALASAVDKDVLQHTCTDTPQICNHIDNIMSDEQPQGLK